MAESFPEIPDPLNTAAQRLFGISYLFPYQRLVMANILEAAAAAGISLEWPGEIGPGGAEKKRGGGGTSAGLLPTASADPLPEASEDRSGTGRQIVILPTGAGKSLCFQLPAMLMSGPTLVIYPILSLMADQERRLAERGFSPAVLRGGQTTEERDALWKKIQSGESKFIIANPEVLAGGNIRKRLGSLGIVHTVIDEAHCVSEWGETFRPAYLEIPSILEAVQSPLVTAFTATASAPVLEKIETLIFGTAGARRIVGNPDRPNIEYRSRGCILRNLAVRDLLLANERPAVVFCSSRPGTEHLAKYLRLRLAEVGTPWAEEIRFYHAGLEREEKKALEKWFLHNGEAVLVSTCAFGLGVDKADIRTVIHRDCPPSVEAYLQESGRAGRDGKQSRAVILWGPEDEARFRLARSPQDKERLRQLFDYARSMDCRRERLLKLLNYEDGGDKPEAHCCDVCSGEGDTTLREERSLLDFFRRNRRSYSIKEAAGVLAAAETVRWTEEEAEDAIRALIKKGSLAACRGPLWKGKLTLSK